MVKLRKTEKEVEKKSEGGIIFEIKTKKLVEQEQYATQLADVVKVGDTSWKAFDNGEPWCKVGDVVLIAKYAGQNRVDEETGDIYSIIDDKDIIAYQRRES